MKLQSLRQQVCDANRSLVPHGLVTLTWGNVSAIDRATGLVAIKPSGVDYEKLTPADIVLVDLDGNVADGSLRPSSDTATHVHLYCAFASIHGITHTHSRFATVYAQARKTLPCLGTTHADHFHGTVPVTRCLTPQEVDAGYELATGIVIVEAFTQGVIDPTAMPAVLVAGHAPFTFGDSARKSVENSVALEACAHMAWAGALLTQQETPLEPHILDKHYRRKHGPSAYYGQSKH